MGQPTIPPAAAPSVSGQPHWTVGTLSYTKGGLVALFCWLLWGDFAWSMQDRTVPMVIQLLFKRFEASDTLAGLLIGTLPPALAILVGPIVSYKSDRHRGRRGRRIPFLLAPTPFIVLSMVGLALSPRIGAWLDLVLGARSPGCRPVTLAVLALGWTSFAFACIVANSVFGGLVNDVVPRGLLGRFYGMFRALSLVVGIAFSFWLLPKAETHYVVIFLSIAAFYGVGFTLMCFKVKEGEYPPVALAADHPETSARGGAARTYLKECFGQPYYRSFFAMMATAAMTLGPMNTFGLFYAKSIHMGMDSYGKCVALSFAISLVLAYPLGVLADRWHPIRLTLATLGLYAVTALLGGLFARGPLTFGIAMVAHAVLSGTYYTVSASMGQKLLSSSRFAELMSANGIVTCLGSAAVAPCVGFMLDRSGHAYHYTFFAGCVLAVLAFAANWVMYKKFLARGGFSNYSAPE